VLVSLKTTGANMSEAPTVDTLAEEGDLLPTGSWSLWIKNLCRSPALVFRAKMASNPENIKKPAVFGFLQRVKEVGENGFS
jgi:hypothetical protein